LINKVNYLYKFNKTTYLSYILSITEKANESINLSPTILVEDTNLCVRTAGENAPTSTTATRQQQQQQQANNNKRDNLQ
jgi:hypothetical protein